MKSAPIPKQSGTDSGANRQSENRSEATLGFVHSQGLWLLQVSGLFFGLSDRFSFQFDFVSVVEQAVQDAVSDGGLPDDGMPVFDRALAGDDGGIFLITVLDYFEQVVALRSIKRSEEEIIEEEQLDFSQAGEHFEMVAVGFGLEQHLERTRSPQIKDGMALARGEVAKRTGDINCQRLWDL
jgi:hypothetical protein